MDLGSGHFSLSLFFVFKNSFLPECVRKVLESVILRFLITAKRSEKVLISQEIRTFLVAEAGLEPTASGL